MTRAEEAVKVAYPDNEVLYFVTDTDGKHYPVTTFGREVNGFIWGYEQAEKDYIELAQLWVDSGDVNIMSFKQFLKRHETQSNK